MSIQDDVRGFITTELNWDGPPDALTDGYQLLDGGVLDSVGIFHLVGFLESRYGVEIQDEELVPANFGTLAGIARLVESKQG